jgi:hypothetical protein
MYSFVRVPGRSTLRANAGELASPIARATKLARSATANIKGSLTRGRKIVRRLMALPPLRPRATIYHIDARTQRCRNSKFECWNSGMDQRRTRSEVHALGSFCNMCLAVVTSRRGYFAVLIWWSEQSRSGGELPPIVLVCPFVAWPKFQYRGAQCREGAQSAPDPIRRPVVPWQPNSFSGAAFVAAPPGRRRSRR